MAMSERQIVHVNLDAFYASIETRDNPWLKGQPVIIGGISARGVVCAASREALQLGIHPDMPIKTARRLCPNGVFLKTRINHYKEVSRQIRRILEEYAASVEPVSLDGFYLDVTDNPKGFVTGFEVARDLKKALAERLGLTASVGVAPCKFVAKIASDLNKPDGLRVVSPGEIKEFLAPLPVTVIPGVGEPMRRQLSAIGVHRVGELEGVPLAVLEQTFGRFGLRLREYAQGIDPRPVVSEQDNKSLSRDTTFDAETTDLDFIRSVIAQQAGSLARRLEARGARARTISLTVKYGDYSRITRSVTHDDYFASAAVIREQAAELLAKTQAGVKPVRMVGIELERLWQDNDAVQLSLFDEAGPPRGG